MILLYLTLDVSGRTLAHFSRSEKKFTERRRRRRRSPLNKLLFVSHGGGGSRRNLANEKLK